MSCEVEPLELRVTRRQRQTGASGNRKLAVKRALELDPASASAHAEAAVTAFFYDWDPDAARREFATTLSLDSANVLSATYYPGALLMADSTLVDSAAHVRERGIRLNPGSLSLLIDGSSRSALSRLTDVQRRERCALIARMQGSPNAKCEANRLAVSGDSIGALKLLRADEVAQVPQFAAMTGAEHTVRAKYFASVGDVEDARRELSAAIEKSAHEYVREDQIAFTYYFLGDVDKSVEWWQRAVASNSAQVVFLMHSPQLAAFRKDPRIQAVIAKARTVAASS